MVTQDEQHAEELKALENECDFFKSEGEGVKVLLKHKESELVDFKSALDELSDDLRASKAGVRAEVDSVAKDYALELRQASEEIRALKAELAVAQQRTERLSSVVKQKEDETDELAGELDGYIKKLSESSVPAEIFEEVLKKKTEVEEENERLQVRCCFSIFDIELLLCHIAQGPFKM